MIRVNGNHNNSGGNSRFAQTLLRGDGVTTSEDQKCLPKLYGNLIFVEILQSRLKMVTNLQAETLCQQCYSHTGESCGWRPKHNQNYSGHVQ